MDRSTTPVYLVELLVLVEGSEQEGSHQVEFHRAEVGYPDCAGVFDVLEVLLHLVEADYPDVVNKATHLPSTHRSNPVQTDSSRVKLSQVNPSKEPNKQKTRPALPSINPTVEALQPTYGSCRSRKRHGREGKEPIGQERKRTS